MKKLWIKHRVLSIFLIVFASIFVINAGFNLYFSFGQYGHNAQQWDKQSYDLIERQWEMKDYKYGFGDIVANGCGSIAIYNILSLDNRDVTFPEVIKNVSLHGLPLFGILGTYPHVVLKVLNLYGYKTSVSFDTNNFDNIAKEHKYNIYCFISTSYGHYELAYDYNGTDFQFVNPTFRTTFAQEVEDTSECIFKMLISVD